MLDTKIPCTVVTGFLGAGKTTIIRNLLADLTASNSGRRIALIINEFGDLGVDGEVLKGCGDETCTEDDIVELTNGCICCTVADDFVPTITALLEREERPDHIVIETSGLALPQPLVAAFNWPEIKPRVTVDGVVTIVDSAAVAAGRFAHDEAALDAQRKADDNLDHESPLEELFGDQIKCADLIVLNKTDLIDADALASIRATVQDEAKNAGSNGAVKMVEAREGRLPASLLIGLESGAEDDLSARKSHHEAHHDDHDHHNDHEHDHDHGHGHGHSHHHHHDHDHDEFSSFVVAAGEVEDVEAFKTRLAEIISAHDILRLKGFVAVAGKPMRLTVQAVGTRVDAYFDGPFTGTRETKLVVIGLADIDPLVIGQAIMAAAKPVASAA
ncbi:MAG: cobalamin biosynthesis protein CobW [Pseudomonadota bacterium]